MSSQTNFNTLTVLRASAGTGKTYTLSARYIALLMDSDDDFLYRNILAVTFTNKATAEMKQRILAYLYIIAERDDNDGERKGFIANVTGYMTTNDQVKNNDTALRGKARMLYHNILDDYDNMRVTTIDSFLQTLINGMAHMAGIGASFGVALDIKHYIGEAVDELMTSYILEDPQAKIALEKYVEERLDDEKSWDIRKGLIDMAIEMLKESVQKHDDNVVYDINSIREYKELIRKVCEIGKEQIRPLYLQVKDCKGNEEIDKGKNYYSFIERVGESLEGNVKNEDLFRGLGAQDAQNLDSDKFLAKFKDWARAVEVQQVLLRMHNLCGDLRTKVLVLKLTTHFLNDLTLMGFVKGRIDERLYENNSILLARTAYTLAKALKPGDADFILEKAGIRYSHIMIDEFQDTSALQWQIFASLVSEILSSGGTTLIVGDVKQSIYRWRNGDYRIMSGLNEQTPLLGVYFNHNASPLIRNYRSQSNVVKFNLSLFGDLIADNAFAQAYRDIYKEGAEGYSEEHLGDFHSKGDTANGYVQFRAYPVVSGRSKPKNAALKELTTAKVRKQIVSDLFGEIEALIDGGAEPSDILILIRKNKEIKELIDAYHASNLPERDIKICSNDSFLLESSKTVQIVVNSLKAIVMSDPIAMKYLELNGIDTKTLEGISRKMPLYEMVETIVEAMLSEEDNALHIDDEVYLNSLLDKVRDFVDNYGSDARAFIRAWNDDIHAKAVPASKVSGIRIMTIHTSKGLESKHLFIPFCNWNLSDNRGKTWVDAQKALNHINLSYNHNQKAMPLKLIPIEISKTIAECGYEQEYAEEMQAQHIDNLNVLYVALTRAADNLYIYAPVGLNDAFNSDKSKTVGDLMACVLNMRPTDPTQRMDATFEAIKINYKEGDNTPWAQYTLGFKPYIANKSGKKNTTPFDYHYSDDDKLGYTAYTSNKSITFRQSQESMLYTYTKAEDSNEKQRRIDAGILRHNILSEICTLDETAKVLDKFYTKGLIETKEELETIREELNCAWHNPQMADWFGGKWRLLREVAILLPQDEYRSAVEKWKAMPADKRGAMPKRELRPDRVMIRGKQAVVLDFKFGKHNHSKYSAQVNQYIALLKKMGYTDVKGYLWYGFDNEIVAVD